MTTHELPFGYGRPKPDIVSFGVNVMSSKPEPTGCRALSGTSVASPVATGAVALLASTIPKAKRAQVLNPGSMKQALVEGADRLSQSIYEVGAGRINLLKSANIMREYQPRASLHPAALDFTDEAWMWPHSKQQLYAGALPYTFNATIVNGMSSTGELKSPPGWVPSNEGGKHLEIEFEYSAKIWPYHGYLALHFSVKDSGKDFTGTASGDVIFTVISPPAQGESEPRVSTVKVPVKVKVIPTPPREKRILWDQFHSISYPSGFLPSDNRKKDQLDWLGDHPHTNFWTLTEKLQNAGYFLEILGHPATCFNAESYGAYLVVDPEEEWFKEEVDKLYVDVTEKGLHLLVLADWYDLKKMEQLRFFDDNTRSFWTPITGGCNVPALNDLLGKFGIELGGDMAYLDREAPPVASFFAAMYSGSPIIKFPKGGTLAKNQKDRHGVVGSVPAGKGHVSVLGDSSLFDDGNKNMGGTGHFEGLQKLLQKTYKKDETRYLLEEDFNAGPEVTQAVRPKDVNFAPFSNVVGKEPFCGCRTTKTLRSEGQPCVAAAASELKDLEVGSNVKAEPSSSIDWEKNPRPKTSNLFDKLGLNGERGHSASDFLHPTKKTTPGDKDSAPKPVVVNSQSMVKLPILDNQMSLIMGAGGFVLVLLLWRLNAQTAPGARRVARAGRRLPESAV
jgi:membrane-bound transcription factor site-1 protease